MAPKSEVNRCVCHRRTFEKLLEYAREENITTADELVERRFCGCGCGLCIPYIKLMLRTGKVSFNPEDISQYDNSI